MDLARHAFQPGALALAAGIMAGCETRLPVTPLEDLYQLQVAATRTSYVAGDSVAVRITNGDDFPFIWHRCRGVRLERRITSGWTETPSTDACTSGSIAVPANDAILILFVLPLTASAGEYRVQVRLSVINDSPPLFWWSSVTFTVATLIP